MRKQEDMFLPKFRERGMNIFNRRFPAIFDDPMYDPTKMTILTGDDGVLDDLFSYQVYNKIKNHWPGAVRPADVQQGMIWYDTDVDKWYGWNGAADKVLSHVVDHADLANVTANQHHAQAHTLASHSSKAHTELTGVTSDLHHAQVHTLGSHSDFGTYLDQAVKTTSNPTFANVYATNFFCLYDTGADHYLQLYLNENLSAHRTLNIIVSDGTRSLTISGNSGIDQDLRTSATPSFAHINLTNATSTITGGTALWLAAGTDGIRSQTIYDDTTANTANLYITGATLYQIKRESSALKYKDKVKDLEIDSSLIYNLRPVSFNSKCKGDDKDKRFIGLIADEIEQEIPEIVMYNKNNEAESYDRQMLMTLMLKEIQNLHQEIETLKTFH